MVNAKESQFCWSKKKRAFLVHYFPDGQRRVKWIPVDVTYDESHCPRAIAGFEEWLARRQSTGEVPRNLEVVVRHTMRSVLPVWKEWKLFPSAYGAYQRHWGAREFGPTSSSLGYPRSTRSPRSPSTRRGERL